MANTIAQLAVKLGLETTEFEQAIASAKSKVTELANKLPEMALAGAVALGAMATKALNFSDQISDLSDATGISISKILQLSDALEMSGGHFDDAGKVVEKFADNIDKAAQGSKPLQDAFARIGVGLQDLKSLSTEDLLKKTTEGIANMGDKASQTGEKVALFGKSMRGVDMNAFNEEIQKSSEEYDKYQAAIALTADMHDRLEKKTMMLTLAFTQHLMPTIDAMLEIWVSKGGLAEAVFDKLNKLLVGLWYAAGSVGSALEVMGAAWDKIFNKMTDEQYQEKLRKIYADQIMFRGKLQALVNPQQADPKNPNAAVNRDVTAAKDPEADKQKNMLYTATLISEEYRRQQVFSLQQLAIRNQMVGMTNDEKKVQEAINQVLDATSKKVDEITKAREAAAGRGANEQVLQEYDNQIKKVEELSQAFVDLAKQQEQYAISVQRTFEFGWNKAFKQYAEDAYNYGKMGEDSFRSITGNMTNAINTFVETGKFSFSSFARSVILDLLKIQAQALATKAMTAAFSSISGSSIVTTGLALLGFADGGRPPTDQPSIVGERGPEIFVPDRPGTIIPNNQLSNSGGSQPSVVYNGPYIANMTAIDTQSATQFLAKNKTAVWAANLSASRSLPTTR